MNPKTASPSASFLQALHLREASKNSEALQLLFACYEIQKELGKDQPDTLHALFELAWLQRELGQVDHYIAAFELLNHLSKTNPAIHPVDRATYELNHGIALLQANRPEDAEAIIRNNAQFRANLFGVDHAEYGLCLEYFSEALAGQHKISEAAQAIDSVIGCYYKHQVPRMGRAIMLRSLLSIVLRPEEDPFDALQVPIEIIVDAAQQILNDIDRNSASILRKQPEYCLPLLRGLHQKLSKVNGIEPLLLLQIKASLARYLERISPSSDERLPLIRELAHYWNSQSNPTETYAANMHLALCLVERPDDHTEAHQAFQTAIQVCTQLTPRESAIAFRQYGLFLLQTKQLKAADAQLRAAMRESEKTQDSELILRAQVALGILAHAKKDFDQAIPILHLGIAGLPNTDADGLLARQYRIAAEAKKETIQEQFDQALCEAFRDQILSKFPSTLFKGFAVALIQNQFTLQVEPVQELQPEQLEALQLIIAETIDQFKLALGGNILT